MKKGLPIRWKLLLLAGIPVLGAILLSIPLIRGVQEDARKARALGSVENLAKLNATMGVVIHELQLERAWVAATMGRNAALRGEGELTAQESESRRRSLEQARAAAQVQSRATDEAIRTLGAFLGGLDETDLPPRLALHLGSARKGLAGLGALRKAMEDPKQDLASEVEKYGVATTSLIAATAALNEMTDDGELLRTITVLVALLQEKEAASVEHAILAYVFSAGEFPPGTYRTLVTRITEQEAHAQFVRTLASTEQLRWYETTQQGTASNEARTMRDTAIKAVEEELRVDPARWFDAQRTHVEAFSTTANNLNERVKSAAMAKAAQGRANILLSVGLTSTVLLASVLMAWLIARGISRNVFLLTAATERVAQGDLETRVKIESGDELGRLGSGFNKMIADIAAARIALEEKSRMARELEIAASIQRAVLPPDPRHRDFEFSGRMLPADEVGGDFYDVLTREGSTDLWLAVGDVSNHGLEAGLVMLMAQAAIASHFEALPGAAPDDVIRRVNRVLRENIVQRRKDEKYLTAQVWTYAGEGVFRCAGAHTWPIVWRAATGKCEVLETTGPWLGIVPEIGSAPVTELKLEHGDVLCLYSDGLTESRDARGELFDTAGLTQALEKAAGEHASVDAMADSLIEAVSTYAVAREDDWTVLLVRRPEATARA